MKRSCERGVVIVQALVMTALVALVAAVLLRLNLGSFMISQNVRRSHSDLYLSEAAMGYATAAWKNGAPADIDTDALPAGNPLRDLACSQSPPKKIHVPLPAGPTGQILIEVTDRNSACP